MPPRIARLAGLGAFGACAGLIALFLLIAWISRPTRTGGIDPTLAWIVWIALAGVFAEAYLYADLDNVARIVDRVVQTLDRNPQILTQVLKTVDTAVNSLNSGLTGQPPSGAAAPTSRPPQ